MQQQHRARQAQSVIHLSHRRTSHPGETTKFATQVKI